MSKIESPNLHENIRPQEACGVTAVFSKTGDLITPYIPTYQYILRNRGRDATGMASYNPESGIQLYKGSGQAPDVFPEGFDFGGHGLLSDRGIGHNRYATNGGEHKDDSDGAQPVLATYRDRTIAFAFNGNISDENREILQRKTDRMLPPAPDFDSYDLARAIVSAHGSTWPDRIRNALHDVPLAYSFTMVTGEGDIYGYRSISGTWPLRVGESDEKILFSSETKIEQSDAVSWRSVNPGELVRATPDGVESQQLFEIPEKTFQCALHDMYTADMDSMMTDEMTYRDFRREAGRILAEEHPILDADLYVGVPETGLVIAEGYAWALGKTTTEFIKKRDPRRTFIAKSMEEAVEIVHDKFEIPNPDLDLSNISLQKVVVIDDSTIKGNTHGGDPLNGKKGIVEKIRDAGAVEVDMEIALSMFVEGCDMGVYIEKDQLVALVKDIDGTYIRLTPEELAVKIGADSVHFMSVNGLRELYRSTYGEERSFCMRCMGGPHPEHELRQRPAIKLTPIYEHAAAGE